MSSATAFDFQIPFGFYPQKRGKMPNLLYRSADAVQKTCKKVWLTRSGKAKGFLGAVEACEKDIVSLAPRQLDDCLQTLRFEAKKSGIHEAYVAKSFAIIREMSRRTLGMRPYHHQLIGGWAMMHGYVIEMETGQGKSLCATLTACAAALAGVATHVITVNEYLACRDAEKFSPLYNALGLTVSAITEAMSEEEKQQAYQSDVVYCTNKQVAFDYLRDRIALRNECGRKRLQLESLFSDTVRREKLILQGLCFAIIDEADSVLIDEAVTPLIISAAKSQSGKQPIYDKAFRLSGELRRDTHFSLQAGKGRVELTQEGIEKLDEIGKKMGGMWGNPNPREELVVLALKARLLYIKGKHYLVDEGKVKIVDEFTGRMMPDRSWSEGLHQLVEIKEGCELTAGRETLAKISYQRFFRRYINLAGMTGTAAEVRKELKSVYGLDVYRVPRSEKSKRYFRPVNLFNTESEKWSAIVERIKELNHRSVPILVGTKSVESSMILSHLLTRDQIPHQLLNALQDKRESDIISQAGGVGQITVATNMAGRGTDIKVSESALGKGGLHVLMTEKHEARRIDRQLFGRCGRQSDPGAVEIFLSLQDDLIQHQCKKLFVDLCRIFLMKGSRWAKGIPLLAFSLSQVLVERRQYKIRKQLLKMDEQHENILAFSGLME